MKKTYAYNGIVLGILAGFCVGALTDSIALAIIAGVAGLVLFFFLIRTIEKAIDKGVDAAAGAIKNRIDASHQKKAAEKQNAAMTAEQGTFCVYCGEKIPTGIEICPKCGKSINE